MLGVVFTACISSFVCCLKSVSSCYRVAYMRTGGTTIIKFISGCSSVWGCDILAVIHIFMLDFSCCVKLQIGIGIDLGTSNWCDWDCIPPAATPPALNASLTLNLIWTAFFQQLLLSALNVSLTLNTLFHLHSCVGVYHNGMFWSRKCARHQQSEASLFCRPLVLFLLSCCLHCL